MRRPPPKASGGHRRVCTAFRRGACAGRGSRCGAWRLVARGVCAVRRSAWVGLPRVDAVSRCRTDQPSAGSRIACARACGCPASRDLDDRAPGPSPCTCRGTASRTGGGSATFPRVVAPLGCASPSDMAGWLAWASDISSGGGVPRWRASCCADSGACVTPGPVASVDRRVDVAATRPIRGPRRATPTLRRSRGAWPRVAGGDKFSERLLDQGR